MGYKRPKLMWHCGIVIHMPVIATSSSCVWHSPLPQLHGEEHIPESVPAVVAGLVSSSLLYPKLVQYAS